MTTSQPITLVALNALAGSGKDEAARQLAPFGWDRRAFGDKLRECLLALNPVVYVYREGDVVRVRDVVEELGWEKAKPAHGGEIRRLLQRLGTEAGRDTLGPNVWVDAVMRDLPVLTVITDCRFPNEAQAVVDRGGLVGRIIRPGVEPIRDPGTGEIHPSETALDDWPFDFALDNSGTLEHLGELVREAIGWHAESRPR